MESKVRKVEELYGDTPAGYISDADTILADIMSKCDFDITGLAMYIIAGWKKTTDKSAYEDLFYALTDVYFNDFINMCIAETTISDN